MKLILDESLFEDFEPDRWLNHMVYNALSNVKLDAISAGIEVHPKDFRRATEWFISRYFPNGGIDESLDEELESSENMQSFDVSYSIDGVRTEKTVKALNQNQAKELIKKENSGKNVTFQGVKEHEEKLESLIRESDEEDIDDTPIEDSEDISGVENGMSNAITDLIQSEFEVSSDINDVKVTFDAEGHSEYNDKLSSIADNTNTNIGELQNILKDVNPSAENIQGAMENEDGWSVDEKSVDDDVDDIDFFIG